MILKSLNDLTLIRNTNKNKKIVMCNGTFDPLHYGHIRHFKEAKKLGDILVVAVLSDYFLHIRKGNGRPIFYADIRCDCVDSLECVDYVIVNEWDLGVEIINNLKPDIYVKGEDYKNIESLNQNDQERLIKEINATEANGGHIEYTKCIYGTSELIKYIKEEL